jgi:branched-chain amino acid transport system permease protein
MVLGFLLSVLSLASINFLLGLAIVVVYKGTRVLNFALLGTLVLTSYVALSVAKNFGLVWGLVAGLVISVPLGVLCYVLALRPFLGRPPYVALLATLAIGLLLEALTIFIWQGATNVLPYHDRELFRLGDAVILKSHLLIWAVGLGVGLLYSVLYRMSALGLQLRAVADKPLLSQQRGISVQRILTMAMVGCTVIGYAAAILLGLRTGISPGLSNGALRGLVVAMVGGVDSALGTVLAAVTLGVLEAGVATYQPQLAEVVIYVALLIVLLVRPWGLFGTREELDRV